MKIDPSLLSPQTPPSDRTTQSQPNQTPPERTELATSVKDEARLSVNRETTTELRAKLQDLPEVRQEQVLKLAQAINEGKHQVSDRQIAEAIFKELLGQKIVR